MAYCYRLKFRLPVPTRPGCCKVVRLRLPLPFKSRRASGGRFAYTSGPMTDDDCGDAAGGNRKKGLAERALGFLMHRRYRNII